MSMSVCGECREREGWEGREEREGREGRALVEAMLLIQSATSCPDLQCRSLLHQMSLSRSLLSRGGS